MARTYPEYNYDLPEGLFQDLSELAVTRLAGEPGGRPESGPSQPDFLPRLENFFCEYGKQAARAVLAAGKKYRDRTAEVMEEAARKTGLVFPGLPQRCIEIWLLAARPRDKWRILENSTKRLAFAVSECSIYRLIKERYPDPAASSSLPCSQGCLAFLEEIHKELALPVGVTMPQTMERQGNCSFSCELNLGV